MFALNFGMMAELLKIQEWLATVRASPPLATKA
jgi:hypothetical protein